MKKGDLIQFSDGRFATVTRGNYNFKFMQNEDFEMVDAGLGHLAGLYGTAFDVMFSDTGRILRMKLSARNYKIVSYDRDNEINEVAMSFADDG